MRVIIAGSRTINDMALLMKAVELSEFDISEVVSGGARGADALGEKYAFDQGLHLRRFYPNWAKYGQRAGPIRNREMAIAADAAIILWDGKSKGAASMQVEAKRARIPFLVIRPGESSGFDCQLEHADGSYELFSIPEIW